MEKDELDHVTQVIGYHPRYLEQYLKTQKFVMESDGPLPFDYRHYLAIIVRRNSTKVEHFAYNVFS
jgi:sestrin 1/3